MKLLLLVALFLPLVAGGMERDILKIPWPKVLHELPMGDEVTFKVGGYEIRHHIPDDPKVQSAGGSGGPIVEITLRDLKTHSSTTLTEQSVAERVLEAYGGKPQLELWIRGGGGAWSRCLYRHISGEYRCVRIDDFESIPRHHNQHAKTAKLPIHFHGRAPPTDDGTLYFIETRIPNP